MKIIFSFEKIRCNFAGLGGGVHYCWADPPRVRSIVFVCQFIVWEFSVGVYACKR